MASHLVVAGVVARAVVEPSRDIEAFQEMATVQIVCLTITVGVLS
jgi:hypothetical protein